MDEKQKLRELETHMKLLQTRYDRLRKQHIRESASASRRIDELEEKLEEVRQKN